MAKVVKVWHVGKLNYSMGIQLQNYLSRLHNINTTYLNDTLLCLEHYPVYTTGIRNKQYTQEESMKLKSTGMLGKISNLLNKRSTLLKVLIFLEQIEVV